MSKEPRILTDVHEIHDGGDVSFKIKRHRKSHRKSRLGCLPCKKKRKKCGEELPVCKNCRSSKYTTCSYLNLSQEEINKIIAAHDGANSLNGIEDSEMPESTKTSKVGKLQSDSMSNGTLPNGVESRIIFQLYKHYPKPAKPSPLEVQKNYSKLFDRVKFCGKLKLIVISLIEKTFFNAIEHQDVFYSLQLFIVHFLLAKSVLRADYLNEEKLNLPQQNDSIRVFIKLHYKYCDLKESRFLITKANLVSLLSTHDIQLIQQTPSLNNKLSTLLSISEDVISWDDFSKAYTSITGYSNPHYNCVACYRELDVDKIDHLKLMSNLSKYPKLFPSDFYYHLQNSYNLATISESIKSIFIPGYSSACVLELYEDLVQFWTFFKHDDNMQSELDDAKMDYLLLADLLNKAIKDYFPILESTDSAVVNPDVYITITKLWYQVLSPKAYLIHKNRSMSPFKRVFYLYFFATYQILSMIFSPARYFFTWKNLNVDFFVIGWFNELDFEFLNNTIDDPILNHFRLHTFYLLRIIAFFRIRRLISLRYLNLNTQIMDKLEFMDHTSFTKSNIFKYFHETPITSFKNTIIKPEHYIHCLPGDPNDFIEFSVPPDEPNSLFAKEFNLFNDNYLQELNERVGNLNFKISNYSTVKYFDMNSGLLSFDFDPYQGVENYKDLKSNLNLMTFDTVSKYFMHRNKLMNGFSSNILNTGFIPNLTHEDNFHLNLDDDMFAEFDETFEFNSLNGLLGYDFDAHN